MFPIAHSAFDHIDPFYFTLIRYDAVTIILVFLLLWREGKQAFRFEGYGLQLCFFDTMAFVVYNILIFWGEDLLGEPGAMVASVMEALMPMISIVLLRIVFRKRPHSFTTICVIVAFIGAMFVIMKGDFAGFLGATSDIIPSILIFIAVVGWVIYTIGGSRFNGWSALQSSTLSCLLGTLTATVVVTIATMVGYVSIVLLHIRIYCLW
ncbi:EamA family transporter [Pueribacillus sp. YX66]|uniref:EamA family transporter n=1 Tax=Pueribacillus sp. YX66 TaxID=3229242 RepID=UPI00358D5D31